MTGAMVGILICLTNRKTMMNAQTIDNFKYNIIIYTT